MTRPFVIGVTGGIASGKSLVTEELAKLGAETIDADRVYHHLIAAGMPLNAVLIKAFGKDIESPDGSIDRRSLGRIVFADTTELARLETITHPAIDAEIRHRLAARRAGVVVIDAVKLYESGLDGVCDQVWVVTAATDQRLERLMRRNGIDREDAARRIAAQPDFMGHARRATAVIDNDGPPEATRRQVERLWEELPRLSECK